MPEYYVGEIRIFPYIQGQTFDDFIACNGQLLSIQSYPVLFSLIGTTYGGDGKTNFAVPNLASRVAVGMGQAPTMGNYALGATGGSESVVIAVDNLPSHTHSFNATTAAASSPLPSNAVPAVASDSFKQFVPNNATPTAPTLTAFSASAIANSVSGDSAHENRAPTLALRYYIATNGIYPSKP